MLKGTLQAEKNVTWELLSVIWRINAGKGNYVDKYKSQYDCI